MSKYENDVSIDQHSLDFELIRQADLYLKYSEFAVDAGFIKDKLKEKIRLVESETDLEIRKDWAKFGFDSKPTEGAIRACIIQDKDCKKINIEYLEAISVYNSLNGVKVALEHKKKSLELLVGLVIRGYSAEPKVGKEFKDNSQKEGHRVLNSKLSNNKRMKLKKKA